MTLVRKAKSARRILVAACGAVLATSLGASAAVQTWTGGGLANDNWTNRDNWLGSTAPVAGDALIFDSSLRLTPSNDFSALTSFTGIGFSSTAGAFTLGGNAITLSGDVTSDSSGQSHTINLGLVLDANRTVRVSDSNVTINGVISGTGSGITKTGNGILTLGAVNTYTGPTVIDGGTLAYVADNFGVGALNFGFTPAATSASTNSGTLDLNNASLTASSLTLQNNTTTPNIITIGSGKTLTVNGAFTVGPSEAYTNTVSASQTNLTVSGDNLIINGGA